MKHAREDYNKGKKINEIPADEPVFLIRAQDILSATVVRFWADENEKIGGDPKLIESARRQADLMDAWPTKKKADL